MDKQKDPVCGMMIDPDGAAGQSSCQGTTMYFCSTQCKTQFDANPGKFVNSAGGSNA